MIKNKSLFIVFAAIPLLAGCWWKKDAATVETAVSDEASEIAQDMSHEEVSPCESDEEHAAIDDTDEK